MANPDLLPAVKPLVRRLRHYFLPRGHPPEMPSWNIEWGEIKEGDEHPLDAADSRFSWLLGDPDRDATLHFCIENFEPLRKTSVALKLVDALLESANERSSNFRVAWNSLLATNWIHAYNRSTSHRREEPATHSIGFVAESICAHLLTDLLDAAATSSLTPTRTKSRTATKPQSVKKARLTESRDKWIYEQCCNGEPYDLIARKLPKKNQQWLRISSKQGILEAARRYAGRHDLPNPPPRQER